MLLQALQQNVAQLKGLGTKACQNLSRLQILHICDLLQHYPARYLNHLQPCSLAQVCRHLARVQAAPEGAEVYFYICAQVIEHHYIAWRASQALKVILAEDLAPHDVLPNVAKGTPQTRLRASLLCFGRNFLAAQLPVGSHVLVAGHWQLRYGELQTSRFTFEISQNVAECTTHPSTKPQAKESGAYHGSEFDCLLPLYPLTQGITQKQLRAAIAQALGHFSFAIEDEVPVYLQQKHNLLGKKEALRQIHFPVSKESLLQAHRSLVYEELLPVMLLIERRRLQQHRELQQRQQHFCLQGPGHWLPLAQSHLPFDLSEGQRSALEQILHSFTLDVPMNRLLQGDVGSGKTIVALLSALPWLEAGAQVVLMAPTEILARQLLHHLAALCHKLEHAQQQTHGNFMQATAQMRQRLGKISFLSGSVSGAKRKEILQKLRKGEIRSLVGTHALFSQAVEFANLRYIIVDEQHRFGVQQRLALKDKALEPPHVLLMSATPIPRTLALTLYGDLDISSINTMPCNRKPIKTHLVRQGNDAKMYEFARRELAAGRQAYFIYPLISPSEGSAEEQAQEPPRSQLRNVQQMHAKLQRVFSGYRLGIVHGQMTQEQKDAAMDSFRANEVQILLATTVVEVGVDVPNASVMVVEHAERFGLAQLHQLRGRVGRGHQQGYCFLSYCDGELTDTAKERLVTLKECSDGFAIAEKDLELRGPGDLLGAEQTGIMELRIAKIPQDLPWLERARLDAATLLAQDYGLLQAEHQTLRQLLEGKGSLDA